MSAARDTLVHGLLALGALGLAVWATDAPDAVSADSVEITNCRSVSAVRFRSPRRDVDVELDSGDVVWIEITQRPEQAVARVRRFRGGEEALAYLDSLSPLLARRSLGELEGDALDEVGLTSSDETWTVVCDNDENTFVVGGRAYGTGDRYVRASNGGPIYLLPVGAIRALATAEVRLMQRKLLAVEFAELTNARARTDTRTIELEHRNRRAHDAAWVEAGEPSERRRDLDQLMRAFDHLSIQEYLEEDPPATTPIVRFDVTGLSGSLGFVEVARETNGTTTYARSSLSESWVILIPSTAAELVRAVDRLPEP